VLLPLLPRFDRCVKLLGLSEQATIRAQPANAVTTARYERTGTH
jgi:hypothetical protein